MRSLIALIVVVALAWCAWWFIGASAVERTLAEAFATRRDEGWVANYATLNTSGFPNRFDTTLTEIELADPATGIAWSAPLAQILALSYKPNHIILALPPEQVVATPVGQINVDNRQMRGSVVLKPGTDLTLDRSTFVADEVVLTRGLDRVEIAKARLAARPTPVTDVANTYDIALDVTDLTLPDAIADQVGGAAAVGLLRVPTTVTFDAPLDRHALTGQRPIPTQIDVNGAELSWGKVRLEAEGRLTTDAAGAPEGQIDLTVRGWGDLLDILRTSGMIPADQVGNLRSGLGLLSVLSGGSGKLELPLIFSGGQMALGPVPLGPAPRFVSEP